MFLYWVPLLWIKCAVLKVEVWLYLPLISPRITHTHTRLTRRKHTQRVFVFFNCIRIYYNTSAYLHFFSVCVTTKSSKLTAGHVSQTHSELHGVTEFCLSLCSSQWSLSSSYLSEPQSPRTAFIVLSAWSRRRKQWRCMKEGDVSAFTCCLCTLTRLWELNVSGSACKLTGLSAHVSRGSG